MKWEHPENCMCDVCIKRRTVERIAQRSQDAAQRDYERRRGGEIGSISVADARMR